jgi:hypothetical protein
MSTRGRHRSDFSLMMLIMIRSIVQVVNHTSNLAAPFLESAAAAPGSTSEEGSKRDWYIWKKGSVNEHGERIPPNNWGAAFGGVSALLSSHARQVADLVPHLDSSQSVWEVSSRPAPLT